MIKQTAAVRMGEMRVAKNGGTLTTYGVGSCIIIAICDAQAGIGGLVHPMLPDPPANGTRKGPSRYVATAPKALLERMLAAGADESRLSVWLVGGASMFPNLIAEGLNPLGERNVTAARRALERAGLRVTGEDVGGNHGRTITLHVAESRLRVLSATGEIRQL